LQHKRCPQRMSVRLCLPLYSLQVAQTIIMMMMMSFLWKTR